MSGNPPGAICRWPGCAKPPERYSSFCSTDTSRLQVLYGSTTVNASDLAAAPERWESRQRVRRLQRPAIGWVGVDVVASDEVARLRARVAVLEAENAGLRAWLGDWV